MARSYNIWKVLKGLNPYTRITSLAKELKDWQNLLRPYASFNAAMMGSATPVSYPYSPELVYNIARNQDTIKTILLALRRECFRNEFEVLPAEEVTSSEQTGTAENNVDDKERINIHDELDEVNSNEQSMVDVLEEFEDNLNTFDDGYLCFIKEYTFSEDGEVTDWDVLETISIDPRVIGPLVNKAEIPGMNDEGKYLMFDLTERHSLYTIDPSQVEDARSKTGKKLYRAYYKHTYAGKDIYYAKDEIVHLTRYTKSKTVGYSPIITLMQKIRILMGQDKYMMELYEGKRPPKGLLIFNTPNTKAMYTSWNAMLENARNSPHMPAALALENGVGQNQRKIAEYIDFMRNLQELQFTESRDELRRAIGATYGVLPIWQADTSTSGGLNNEGLQVTVTNRAIEYNQNQYNKKVWPRIVRAYKWEGWVIRLKESEEQDEMAKLQREEQSLNNADTALKLGLECEYDEKTKEVHIKSGKLEKPAAPDFGTGSFNNEPPKNDPSGAPPEPPKKGEEPDVKDIQPVGKSGGEASGEQPHGGVDKTDSQQPPFTKLADIIKEQIEKFIKKYGKKPTEQQLKDAIFKFRNDFEGELKRAVATQFKRTYEEAMSEMEHKLDMNFTLDQRDLNALDAMLSQDVLSKSFKNLSEDLAGRVQEVIMAAYNTQNGLSLDKMREQLKQAVSIGDSRAELIARTETGKVSSAARRNSYLKADPEDTGLYKHIGPDDHRTTPCSREIKNLTRNGVPWDEYVRILTAVSKKYFPTWTVDPNAPQSHWNSRHTFIRIN